MSNKDAIRKQLLASYIARLSGVSDEPSGHHNHHRNIFWTSIFTLIISAIILFIYFNVNPDLSFAIDVNNRAPQLALNIFYVLMPFVFFIGIFMIFPHKIGAGEKVNSIII